MAESTPITKSLLDLFNRLDNQITEIVLAAAKHVCPKQHEMEWSVELYNQSKLCKYWALVAKGVRNKVDTTR